MLKETVIPDDINGVPFKILSRKTKLRLILSIAMFVICAVAILMIGYWVGYNSY